MPQETQLTEDAVQALSAAGIREGDTLGGSVLTPEGTFRPSGTPAVITARSVEDQTTRNIQNQQQDVSSASQGGWYKTKEGTTIYVGNPSLNRSLVEGAQYLGTKKPAEETGSGSPEDDILKSLSKDDPSTSALEQDIANSDAEIKRINDKMDGILTAQNEFLRQQIDYIKQKYEARRQQMLDINRRKMAVQNQLGVRYGTQRYAPQDDVGILSLEETEGMSRIAELDAEERAAISAAQSALLKNQWEQFANERERVENLREKKEKALEAQVKLSLERDKKVQEEFVKFTRDNAIAGAVAQGVTDPVQLLDILNYDDSGKLIGDFTSEEVAKALNNLLPKAKESGDYVFPKDKVEKLIGAGFNFRSVQDIQDDINEHGLAAVLEGITDPKQKAVIESLFTEVPKNEGARNLITISEAKSLGLPITLVGRSQKEIISSFASTTSPDWFREIMDQKFSMNLRPDILTEEWLKFRSEIMADFSDESSRSGSIDYGSFSLPAPVE